MPVRWPPDSPRRTKARLKWFGRFRRLKPGHSLKDLARRWGETYDVVRRWSELFAYDKGRVPQGLPQRASRPTGLAATKPAAPGSGTGTPDRRAERFHRLPVRRGQREARAARGISNTNFIRGLQWQPER
jgi:hypothetical protein